MNKSNSAVTHELLFVHRYRLAPPYHFPVAFEDVYRVVKYFLRPDVLDRYEVDPERVAVSGDSAGGNLAAAVTQQVRCINMIGTI